MAGFTLLPHLNSMDAFTLINQTPGEPINIDPYQAELGGIYGIVATITDLCESFAVTQGTMTIGCHCESALYNLQRPYNPSPY